MESGKMDVNYSISDDDILPEVRLFDYRAENILQCKFEALKSMRLLNTNVELVEEIEEDEEEDLMRKVKEKLKRKPRGRKAKMQLLNTDVEPLEEIKEDEKDLTYKVKEKVKAKPRGRKAKVTELEPVEEVEVKKVTRKSSRRKAVQEDIDVIKIAPKPEVESSPVNLPAVAKRRLNRLKLNCSKQKKRIDEENLRVLSSCGMPSEIDEPVVDLAVEQSTTLKIRYLSDIFKLRVKEEEQFKSICEKVADRCKLKSSEILLCVRDRTIDRNETSLSLNLRCFDIIDCIPYKALEDPENEDNPNRLLLKLQSNDSRKKINMHVLKYEKFKDIMKRYSEKHGLALEKFTFEFDGEKIEGTETPDDLDMENESCVDVKIPTENKKSSPEVIDIATEPIPESEMLQICVLD